MEKQLLQEVDDKPLENSASCKVQEAVSTTANYTFEGRHFDVERVFREGAHDTVATILLKLIQASSESQ